uniref:Cytochrome c oxidase assembly factor 7 n=1 Tax=Otus sunia TaxID=257818 RepID=A0A8C8B3F1_9STRI
MAGFINFEDEEEVRSYLENLHVEYSYHCFKEKDPDGCQRLADYLDAVKKDFVAAARVLRDNCEAHGHSESCYKLGAYQAIGKGGPGSPVAASASSLSRYPAGPPFPALMPSAAPRPLLVAARAPAAGGWHDGEGVAGSSPTAQRTWWPCQQRELFGVRAPGREGRLMPEQKHSSAFAKVPSTCISS